MKNSGYKYTNLTWHQVLNGYAMGIFPMGDEENTVAWYEASPRAIMPVGEPGSSINISRSLKQALRRNEFRIKTNTAFKEVIERCAARESTWINKLIIEAYVDLNKRGYAHSIEAWNGSELAGGLYGVAYKGAFFGESMFRVRNNASKICVVKLYEILKKNEFILLDIQMMTSHFASFGAVEISKNSYLALLDKAMNVKRDFKA